MSRVATAYSCFLAMMFAGHSFGQSASAPEYQLKLRSISSVSSVALSSRTEREARWNPKKTAVILCDVWDYHHSINAVKRLDEMLPRMNVLLTKMRDAGSTIIHSPSDCMETYREHPARQRATKALQSIHESKLQLPPFVASWCSKIESESNAVYPLDQSDGGEDDDPTQHAAWARSLQERGRNPAMPWKSQSPGITIHDNTDFISDRGDEVWAILRERSIQHVVLVGVHTNMCVIGRPFGLRQMKRLGFEVALVRDLTDCMYNPKRWPYVDHFTGNDYMVSYIEEHVCPTLTSDQILGGSPFHFSADHRKERDLRFDREALVEGDRSGRWYALDPDHFDASSLTLGENRKDQPNVMLRCMVRFAGPWTDGESILLESSNDVQSAWLNGSPLSVTRHSGGKLSFSIPKDSTFGNDDPNTLVLQAKRESLLAVIDSLTIDKQGTKKSLRGTWQIYHGDDPSLRSIPLPAKFGLSPEAYFSVP